MKATMTTNPKEKLTTTYFHNKVVMASKKLVSNARKHKHDGHNC
jgi:hypothetical protein